VSHLTYQYTLFFSISRRPPNSTLFPYTTLFRSIWMQYNAHILQDCPFVALQVGQLVHTDHKSGYRRVERKTLDIVFDLFDDLMQCFQFGFAWLVIAHAKTTVCVMRQLPELTKKLIYTFYAIGIPRLALLQWSEKHLIHAQRICAVLL